MSKLSIEEALKAKLPLPWRVTDPTGTSFLVARRRPEDLTKELFEQLEAYGITRNVIRELFYISSNDWGGVMKKLGIEPSKYGGRRPGCGRRKEPEPAGVPAAAAESLLKTVAPAELPKIPVEPLFRANDVGKPAAPESEPVATPKTITAGNVVITESSEGGFVAHIPEKPGCLTQGDTVEEALEMIADAERAWDEGAAAKPTDDTSGLDCEDRHDFKIDPTAFSVLKGNLPIPSAPSDPPANSAHLQITCHDYSLGQLKSILASLPAGTTISGVIHISL